MARRLGWTETEDYIIRNGIANGMTDRDLEAILPGRTAAQIRDHRYNVLNLTRLEVKRFTAADDEQIKADWAAFVPLEDTATKLGRTLGVMRQRVLRLKLTRKSGKTRLVQKYGLDVLKLGNTTEEIRQALADANDKVKAASQEQEAAKIRQALATMEAEIAAGGDKRVALQAARLKGVTLQEIGDRLAITRERVRQITMGETHSRSEKVIAGQKRRYAGVFIDRVKERTIQCTACPKTFVVTRRGAFKYCPECAYNKQRAATAASNAGRYAELRKQNFIKRLENFAPDALREIQAAVAMRLIEANKEALHEIMTAHINREIGQEHLESEVLTGKAEE